MSLLVTGTIGIDTIETPTGSAERVMGGSCSYFAAAACLHAPVRVVGAVGGDWPDDHRKLLESFPDIDLRGLEHRANSKTFAWGGKYFNNMNSRETLFTELGVLEEKPPAIPPAFKDSEYIFLANTHPQVQLELLSHFPRRRLAVADTMDLWINIARDDLLKLLKEVDGLIINNDEAEQLTEITNVITAARKLVTMGPKFVIVKKGEHGAILAHRDGVATMPAYPSEAHQVIDPTGAGDSFAGGTMGHLAATGRCDLEAIQTAIAWGTVTASFTIESFGLSRLAEISREDINERMRLFQSMARIGEVEPTNQPDHARV